MAQPLPEGPREFPALARWHTALWWAATAILAVIAFIGATRSPLGIDEVMSLITARRPFVESLLQREDYSAPLYQLLLKLLVRDGHPPEWLIRAPAVGFAIGCGPAVWHLSRQLFGPRTGALATAATLLNALFAWYAREARPYSLFVLCSVLSMASFWRLLQQGLRRDWIHFVCTSTLLCYAHYYGFLCLLAQALFTVCDRKLCRVRSNTPWSPGGAFGATAIAVMPAAFLAVRYVASGIPALSAAWLHQTEPADLLTLRPVGELLGHAALGPLAGFGIGLAVWQGDAPVSSPASRDRAGNVWERRRATLLCCFWIGCGLGLPVALSAVRPLYRFTYGIPVIVPVILLLLTGLSRLRPVGLPLAIALLGAVNLSLLRVVPQGLQSFPQVIEWIEANCAAGTPVYLGDWNYGSNWISPERTGMEYYGFSGELMEPLPTRFPRGFSLLHPERIPRDRRSVLILHAGRDEVAAQLTANDRRFEYHDFEVLAVFHLQADESP